MSSLKEVNIHSLVVGHKYYDSSDNRKTPLRFVGYDPYGPDFEPVAGTDCKYLRDPETGLINFDWGAGSFYTEE